MCSTPACPRSPSRLSRHGTRYIRYRWRHADWPSIGRISPYGRWHRYPRLESADGRCAWLDPAEHGQVGRQQPKRKRGTGPSRAYTRGNDSRKNPPEYDVAVLNRRRLPICDSYHVSRLSEMGRPGRAMRRWWQSGNVTADPALTTPELKGVPAGERRMARGSSSATVLRPHTPRTVQARYGRGGQDRRLQGISAACAASRPSRLRPGLPSAAGR